MKSNKKALSLPLVMWLVIILWLLASSILEYIIPFSKDIKWIENSTRAYYQAASWVEEWLYFLKGRTDDKAEKSIPYSWDLAYKLETISSGNIIQKTWEGTSEYDKDWNTISVWSPIQIPIWKYSITNMSSFKIAFRVPGIKSDLGLAPNISPYKEIVNWQLSSQNNTLNSSWSLVMSNDIWKSNNNFDNSAFDLKNAIWKDLNWTYNSNNKFSYFYSNECNVSSKICSLKLSIVNDLMTTSWQTIPYLEWRMTFHNDKVPYYYTRINSSWKSYWYRRDLKVLVPRETLIEAFDFTVFQ